MFKFNEALDQQFLMDIYGDNFEIIQIAFTEAAGAIPSEYEKISNALVQKDFANLKHHLHKARPTFSYVGLTKISSEMQEIESMINANAAENSITTATNYVLELIENNKTIIEEEVVRLNAYTG